MSTVKESVNALVETCLQEYEYGEVELQLLADEMKLLLDLPEKPTSSEYNLLHAGLKKVKKYRTNTEKWRKNAKMPVLDVGRAIDDHANKMKKTILEVEVPLANKKKTWDDAIEAERRKEEDRIQTLHEKLDLLSSIPVAVQDENLSDLRIRLRHLEEHEITKEDYQEFLINATKLKIAGLIAIEAAIQVAEKEEQARQDLINQKAEQETTAKRQWEKEAELARREQALQEPTIPVVEPEPVSEPALMDIKNTANNLPGEATAEGFLLFVGNYLRENHMEIYKHITAAYSDISELKTAKAWRG